MNDAKQENAKLLPEKIKPKAKALGFKIKRKYNCLTGKLSKEDACRNRRTNNAGNVRAHRMHQ